MTPPASATTAPTRKASAAPLVEATGGDDAVCDGSPGVTQGEGGQHGQPDRAAHLLGCRLNTGGQAGVLSRDLVHRCHAEGGEQDS